MKEGWRTYLRNKDFKKALDEAEDKSGISGMYVYAGFGIGVKIYYNGWAKTPKKATQNDQWWVAVQAYKAMKLAEKTKIVPKAYGVCVVRVGKAYYPALVMQHINGYHPDWISYSHNETIKRKFKLANIKYDDLHNQNIIVDADDNVFVIDFDYVYTSR